MSFIPNDIEALPESKRAFFAPVFRLNEEKDFPYSLSDCLNCEYCILQLPESDRAFVGFLLLGPFLTRNVDQKTFQKLTDNSAFSSEPIQFLREYYALVPVIEDPVAFQEKCFAIQQAMLQLNLKGTVGTPSAGPAPMEAYSLVREELFRLEGQMLRFVAEGDTQNALRILEKRLTIAPNPQQKSLYAMHALLRREVEAAGVPPFYLDPSRNRLLAEADLCTNPSERKDVLRKIVIEYSTLVRNYSFQGHSPVIRNVLRYIHLHLSDDLSLQTLAKEYSVNASYLSSLFSREIGMTVTDYVNRLRINKAKQLLRNTDNQIQDIAADCGIYDVNYFRKLFKKIVGMTPTEYVISIRNRRKF